MSHKTEFSISKQLADAGVKLPHESVWVEIPDTKIGNKTIPGDTKRVPAAAELWRTVENRYPSYEASEILDALPHFLVKDHRYYALIISKEFSGKDSGNDTSGIGPYYNVCYLETYSNLVSSSDNTLVDALADLLLQLIEQKYINLEDLQSNEQQLGN